MKRVNYTGRYFKILIFYMQLAQLYFLNIFLYNFRKSTKMMIRSTTVLFWS